MLKIIIKFELIRRTLVCLLTIKKKVHIQSNEGDMIQSTCMENKNHPNQQNTMET